MNKGVVDLNATMVMIAAALWGGSGVASADTPDVVGKTFGDAKGIVWQSQMKPVVVTMMGDRVPQDQCYVVSTTRVSTRDARGQVESPPVLGLNLSCYKSSASGKAPGFSAGNTSPSAEAVRTADAEATRKWKQSPNGQEWCEKTYSAHPEWDIDPDCVLEE